MNLDQYANVIKAVTAFALLLLVAYIYKDCTSQKNSTPKSKQTTITKKNEIKHKYWKLDSAIIAIPFRYNDSARANFLRNYTNWR